MMAWQRVEYDHPNLNTSAHWDAIWRSKPDYHRWDVRMPVVKAILERLPNGRHILDVGGGLSAFSYHAMTAGHVPCVVDFSNVAVDVMGSLQIPALQMDFNDWNGRLIGIWFDLAVCLEVLEHLEYPERTMDFISAHVLHAFVSVPNPDRGEPDVDEHLRAYTAEGLLAFLGRWFDEVRIESFPASLLAECRKGGWPT
jgi:2-polyprenyl-3-methyl-5-hydroxy-6-metoxy-1,4-benzoquinol methylase